MDWPEKNNDNLQDSHVEVLSFAEYLEKFNQNTLNETRPTFDYLLDMLNHFGTTEEGTYKLFQTDHTDSPAVFGQNKTQQELVKNLKNFQEEGINNKFILLVGPNGSSKTSIVRKFMKGAEIYSQTDNGSLYTFNWIFPIDNYIKGTLGLADNIKPSELNSYAYLDDKDITAILTSELKDHPILLIPKEQRQQIIRDNFSSQPDKLEHLKKSYIYTGDLSKRNRMIYDALLKSYKGDHHEVLKHIRVERFIISKRYSNGAVTIEPQLHVDARLNQISMDKRLASLPPSLQSLNLFSIQGEAIMANRGILEFSDLLKRPLDAFKYLLMTMESGSLNLNGILTELDIFFIGTSNEIHLDAFKQHPDFKSFTGRFNFVKVPYLLDYNEEERIYIEQIQSLKNKSTFEPLSLKILCMFAVMTRLRRTQNNIYFNNNKKLGEIALKFSPLDKALFISDKKIPEALDTESAQVLIQGYSQIINEYEDDNIYEGKFGLSPRDLKKIIYSLTSDIKNITTVEIIEYLQKFVTKKNEYDFLNMTPQGDFHNPTRFVTLLKEYALDIFDEELRNCLGLIDDRSYEQYIKKYVQSINALIKKEKMKNEITGKFEEPDLYFIGEFEKGINLKETADTFRSHLISKLGAYSLDNPGLSIVYSEVLPDVIKRLQESFKSEQNEIIKMISNSMVFYEAELNRDSSENSENSTPLSKENKQQIEKVVNNLQSDYHYSKSGAISLLKYILKNRY